MKKKKETKNKEHVLTIFIHGTILPTNLPKNIKKISNEVKSFIKMRATKNTWTI